MTEIIREERFGVILLQYRRRADGYSDLRMDLDDGINVWVSGQHPDQHGWPSAMHQLALALSRVDGTFAIVAKDDRQRDKRLADAIDRLTSKLTQLADKEP